MYNIFCDGACSSNRRGHGFGGYGFVITDSEHPGKWTGGGKAKKVTNNIMELWAAIYGLKTLKKLLGDKAEDSVCVIHSDSSYVVSNWNDNLFKWLDRNWTTSSGSKVCNREIWEKLYVSTCNFKYVKFKWLKGHAGHKYNEEANVIATLYAQEAKND
jgi:ribonuclease HI